MSATRLRLDQDIKPLSEFRANASSLLEHVRSSKRPLVLTQRGHSAAVVVDVTEYERLIEELELLREIHVAEQQLAEGAGVPHEQARKQVLASLKR